MAGKNYKRSVVLQKGMTIHGSISSDENGQIFIKGDCDDEIIMSCDEVYNFTELIRDVLSSNLHMLHRSEKIEVRMDNSPDFSGCAFVTSNETKPQYKRGRWPYLEWKENPSDSLQHSKEEIQLPQDFLREISLEADENLKPRSEIKDINRTVYEIVTLMLDKMSQDHKMFKSYKLTGIGSWHDGTKVGDPDDFDFYIELPALSDPSIMTFSDQEPDIVEPYLHGERFPTNELRTFTIENQNFFCDFGLGDTYMTQTKFCALLWDRIRIKMAAILKNLSGTSGFSRISWIGTPQNKESIHALSHQLLWKGTQIPKLVINIDLCIRVKVSPSQINRQFVWKDKPRNEILHLVLRRDRKARLSEVEEQETNPQIAKCRERPASDNRKRVLRIVKVMLSRYIPKKYNSNTFRMESAIQTYWLKTILFYMCLNYPDDSSWSDKLISTRVLELLSILNTSLAVEKLYSFFIPHNTLKRIISDNKYLYGQFEMNVTSLLQNLVSLQSDPTLQFTYFKPTEESNKSKNKQILQKHLLDEKERIMASNKTLAKTFEDIFL